MALLGRERRGWSVPIEQHDALLGGVGATVHFTPGDMGDRPSEGTAVPSSISTCPLTEKVNWFASGCECNFPFQSVGIDDVHLLLAAVLSRLVSIEAVGSVGGD
jgi:hypothetical protein